MDMSTEWSLMQLAYLVGVLGLLDVGHYECLFKVFE